MNTLYFFRKTAGCLWLVVLCILGTASARYPTQGVDQEYCRTAEHCAGNRLCYTSVTHGRKKCSSKYESCRCGFEDSQKCTSSTDCERGERCFNVDNKGIKGQFCMTCRWQYFKGISYVDLNPSTCDGIWLGGYTGDMCFINYRSCALDRTCREIVDDGSAGPCSYSTRPCFCWPANLVACSSSIQCDSGERCAKSPEGVQGCYSCGRVEEDESMEAVDSDISCTTPTPSPIPDDSEGSAASTKPPIFPYGGVSLEYCRVNENCADTRQCLEIIGTKLVACKETSNNCHCRYVDRLRCATSSDCSHGERCFGLEDPDDEVAGQFCWSCKSALTSDDSYVDSDPATCEGVWLGGYTGDICSILYPNCASGRSCVQFLDGNKTDRCAFRTEPCFCLPANLSPCETSDQCQFGERCATTQDGQTACFSCNRVDQDRSITAVDTSPICTTPIPTENVTPEAPFAETVPPTSETTSSLPAPPNPTRPVLRPPCISAAHLEHLAGKDLIYREHLRASVLCDEFDSCATPGHIVFYGGQGMMMASYCEKYSACTKRVMFVNSPIMRRALRISSCTEGLYFTAFSARYESVLEEILIRLLILARL